MPVPLALFVYNRPLHAHRTLASLARNPLAAQSDLHIFSDGPKTPAAAARIEEVREVCRNASGFRSLRIIEREHNLGLAASILAGVGEMLAHSPAVIVLEDDLLFSPYFLDYMNAALDIYADDPRLMSVSAYIPAPWLLRRAPNTGDVWLSRRMMSTGWGTWRDRWTSIDWTLPDYPAFAANPLDRAAFAAGGADLPSALDAWWRGELDSWAIRFAYAHFRQGKFSLLPRHSYIRQIGFDGSGRHCLPNPSRWFETTRRAPARPLLPENVQPDPLMQANFRRFFDRHHALARFLRLQTSRWPFKKSS